MTFRRSVIPLERSGSPTWQALPQPLIRAVRQPQSAFGRPAAHPTRAKRLSNLAGLAPAPHSRSVSPNRPSGRPLIGNQDLRPPAHIIPIATAAPPGAPPTAISCLGQDFGRRPLRVWPAALPAFGRFQPKDSTSGRRLLRLQDFSAGYVGSGSWLCEKALTEAQTPGRGRAGIHAVIFSGSAGYSVRNWL
jgi:hypothetical protein